MTEWLIYIYIYDVLSDSYQHVSHTISTLAKVNLHRIENRICRSEGRPVFRLDSECEN